MPAPVKQLTEVQIKISSHSIQHPSQAPRSQGTKASSLD
ncbi:hypothetical protein SynPROS91_01239 [Synechococcus sp. PROS-9-1]|nr:hypothetical protein SynPROS91_01239 [Synechococcus sp. PROS-9-1]